MRGNGGGDRGRESKVERKVCGKGGSYSKAFVNMAETVHSLE